MWKHWISYNQRNQDELNPTIEPMRDVLCLYAIGQELHIRACNDLLS